MQYCLGCDSERLFSACKHGDADRVRTLLEQGAEPSAEMRSSEHLASPDKTPLLLSVMQGHTECVQLLIDAGALIDVQCGPDLETALHVCCARGKPDIAEQLIAAGANLAKADAIGRSPLFLSCLFDRPECTSVMLAAIQAAGFGGNELHTLVPCAMPTPGQMGQTDFVMGQMGVPLIEQTMTGHNPGATPLYAAACGGSTRCASLLCMAGAKIDARTQNDASPLLVSCQNGHMGVAMLLSSYGAPRDVICTTYSGVDACSAAAPASSDAEALAEEGGHTELLRWLVESRRYSPLHHVQALTAERALELLRAGHSPVARHHSSCKSAADIAAEHPWSPAAATILRAAAPWTPGAHALWGAGARARAAELCKLGYLLAHHVDELPGCRSKGSIQGAFVDAWLGHVMPQAVTWELQ